MSRQSRTIGRARIAAAAGAILCELATGHAAFAQTASATAPAQKPNIVFILADDMGYGDPGCYGQKLIKTPNIDAMAEQGLLFTDAYATSPVCAPSRCGLLTGLHTGHTVIRGNTKVSIGPSDLTVEEILKKAGYDTIAVGKWGVGEPGTDGTPVKKGFNYFYGFIDQTAAHNSYPSFLYRNDDKVALRNVVPNEGQYGQGVASVKVDFANDLFDQEIVDYLKKAPADKPFFLYAPFTAPHANNEAQTCEVPDLGDYANLNWPDGDKRYAALCTRLDSYVGHIEQTLRERHLDQNTLVIYTSDNGPHNEGGNDPDFFQSAGPFRGIKRDLYEGGIREPMIAVWPGHIAPRTVTHQPFVFYDFLATAADLAGAAIPPNTDGISLVPTLLGRPQTQVHDYLYWEYFERGFEQAVRMGDWKGIRHGTDQPLELYDLKSDIAESKNVAAAHADKVARITTIMQTARTDSALFPVRNSAAAVTAAQAAHATTQPLGPKSP